jgi:chromosome partitioning protein
VLVAIGNQKGGVGKTTIAVHLAAAWIRRHRRVVLVDADPQGSAAAWLQDDRTVEVVRHARGGLDTLLETLAGQYDAVVVDTPPGLDRPLREAIRVADLLLIPLAPSPVDVRAVRGTLELAQVLRGRALDVRLILSRVLAGTVLGRTARDGLEPYGVPVARTVLTQRVAVQEAAAMGRSVFDYAPDTLAADEFTALAREIGREVFRRGTDLDQDESPARAEGGR